MAESSAYSCLASVDDAGDILIVSGSSLTLGHRATGDPDVGFLGDVDPIHGRIALQQSFHGGQSWVLDLPDSAPKALHDGDQVSLGASAEFRFEQRDVASASASLALLRGTDAHGARRVILLAPGASGTVRIGPRLRTHVPVAGLTSEIEITRGVDAADAPALVFACEAGARLAGAPASDATSVTVPLPVESRTDLAFGAAPDRRPPFGIVLRPLG